MNVDPSPAAGTSDLEMVAEADRDDHVVEAVAPRRGVAQNVMALFVSQMFTWIFAAAVTTIQPRFLGPVGLGQLRVAYAVWAIVELLAAIGTTTLGTIEVAKNPNTASSMLHRIIKLRMITLI